ncbi:peptidylprolyl isomerase [Clostridium grantii]|uniref:Peptidyl-prolyl cis-trans isomerase n=1 Tax=Clostridium grantii DSM 8605 TaxID=1121316 RepID=A0A1M5TH40_9CLOT|nr:peptidylprolyl isomerase [Clostridium grantii]SHH50072.1 peptidyl-prolyl cis-trans isomerase B (cyclophilin B) [Clostridium grantii DSM 8605]
MKKKNYFLIMISMILVFMVGCTDKTSNNSTVNNNDNSSETPLEFNGPKPIVTIILNDDSQMTLELYPEIAPNTVNNFISLINKKYYDGIIFHRVIEGFMIQGGDPTGTGTGGPGYSIDGEFSSNKFQNDLKHTRGVISMARSGDPNSAGSQFFIMHEDYPSLDGEYAAFGKLIEGFEVLDRIATVEKDSKDKPIEDIVMKTISVDLNGYEWKEPDIN